MTHDFDVAIVGWGPAGATLALLLAHQGLSVCILERETGIYPAPRATHFDAEAMRLFQTVGLAKKIGEQLKVHIGINFLDAEHNLLLDWPRPKKPGPQGWFDSYRFHQPRLEAILRDAFAGFPNCRAVEGVNLFAVEEREDRIVLRFEHLASFELRSLTCKFLVGADGARSTVRRLMGSPVEELQSREKWLIVDLVCRVPVDLPDGTIQLCDPARPTTMAKCVGDRRRWEFMVMPGDDVATMASPDTVWNLLAPWLSRDQATIERAVVYTFYALLAQGWRRGRILAVGDAVHLMPPFLGQGLCSGLRDAANLAWKLGAVMKGEADANLLDTYESERSPHVREYIDLAGKVGSIIQTTDPLAAVERNRQMASNPPVMTTIQPRLGPGLHGHRPPPAGYLSDQPALDDGRLLDDLIGYGFGLLVNAQLFVEVEDALGRRNPDLAMVVVHDHAYLRKLSAQAVLIRPDRYILGVANTAAELIRLISELPVRSKGRREDVAQLAGAGLRHKGAS